MRSYRYVARELAGERPHRSGIMSVAYLVEILLPKETGKGEAIEQNWFEALLEELTENFGGVTSFVRAPGQGLWRSGQRNAARHHCGNPSHDGAARTGVLASAA